MENHEAMITSARASVNSVHMASRSPRETLLLPLLLPRVAAANDVNATKERLAMNLCDAVNHSRDRRTKRRKEAPRKRHEVPRPVGSAPMAPASLDGHALVPQAARHPRVLHPEYRRALLA